MMGDKQQFRDEKKQTINFLFSHFLQRPILDVIIASGREKGSESCTLLYYWHGKAYWGAAHGLSGIIHCLLHFTLQEEDEKAVKSVLKYMINLVVSQPMHIVLDFRLLSLYIYVLKYKKNVFNIDNFVSLATFFIILMIFADLMITTMSYFVLVMPLK